MVIKKSNGKAVLVRQCVFGEVVAMIILATAVRSNLVHTTTGIGEMVPLAG